MTTEEKVTRKYITKDSWQRKEFESGMKRDLSENKARFDLIFPKWISYEDQLFTRLANLMQRWAKKYWERNREKADSKEELARFRESALRHITQWYCWEDDEDHAVAVIFNLIWAEYLEQRLFNQLKST